MTTVSFFTIFIIVFFRLMGASLGIKYNRKIFILSAGLISVSLMILGYHTVPHLADDLYRYYEEIQTFKIRGLKYALNYGTWKDTMISNLFLYLCAVLGNEKIIPMIGAAIIPIVSYIIIWIYSDKKIDCRILFFIELLIAGFCEIYITLSVFRYSYGVALASLIIILDSKGIIKNLPLKVGLYLMLPLIHTSLISVTTIALLTHILSKKALIIEFIVLFFLDLIKKYMSNSSVAIFASIAYKMTQYNSEYSIGTSFLLSTAIIVGVLTIFIICYKEVKRIKINNEQDDGKIYLYNFIVNYLFFLFLMIFSIPALFYRMYYIIIIVSIPLIISYMKKNYSVSKYFFLFVLVSCIFIKFIFQYNNYFLNWILE